jgi:hypothetical protein
MLCSGSFVVVTSCDGLWVGVILFIYLIYFFLGGGLELGQCSGLVCGWHVYWSF